MVKTEETENKLFPSIPPPNIPYDNALSSLDNLMVALIVTFNPDQRLLKSVEVLKNSVNYVVIVDNCSTDKSILLKLIEYCKTGFLTVLELNANRGIAGGLNYGVEYLKAKPKVAFVLTLDQDTILVENDLIRIIGEADRRFDNIGIISLGLKKGNSDEYKEIKHSNTSGNIVRMEVFNTLRFREEFFMDQVDYDFDYEVIKNGYRIVLADWFLIDHKLGVKRGKLIYEPPSRLYYIIRNSTVLLIEKKMSILEYGHQILYWSLSSILHDGIFQYFKILITGLIDGLTRKLGKKI